MRGAETAVGRSILNLLLLLFAVVLFALASAVAQVVGGAADAAAPRDKDYVEARFEERIDKKGE